MEHNDLPPRDLVLGDKRSTAEYILAELEKPRYRDAFLRGLGEGLDAGTRHDKRMYAEMLKLVGGQRDLAVLVVQQFGAKDETELRQLVESGRRMESLARSDVPLEEYFRSAMELLELCVKERAEYRQRILARFGSSAHEVSTNGEPHS